MRCVITVAEESGYIASPFTFLAGFGAEDPCRFENSPAKFGSIIKTVTLMVLKSLRVTVKNARSMVRRLTRECMVYLS